MFTPKQDSSVFSHTHTGQARGLLRFKSAATLERPKNHTSPTSASENKEQGREREREKNFDAST